MLTEKIVFSIQKQSDHKKRIQKKRLRDDRASLVWSNFVCMYVFII